MAASRTTGATDCAADGTKARTVAETARSIAMATLSLPSSMIFRTSPVRAITSAETTPAVTAPSGAIGLAARAMGSINRGGMPADADSRASSTASDPTERDTPGRASRFASIDLALDRRLDTVPIGQPSWLAASLRDLPSSSHRTMGMRYFSGRRLNSASSRSVRSSVRPCDTTSGSGTAGIGISRARRLALIALAFIAVWYATP